MSRFTEVKKDVRIISLVSEADNELLKEKEEIYSLQNTITLRCLTPQKDYNPNDRASYYRLIEQKIKMSDEIIILNQTITLSSELKIIEGMAKNMCIPIKYNKPLVIEDSLIVSLIGSCSTNISDFIVSDGRYYDYIANDSNLLKIDLTFLLNDNREQCIAHLNSFKKMLSISDRIIILRSVKTMIRNMQFDDVIKDFEKSFNEIVESNHPEVIYIGAF